MHSFKTTLIAALHDIKPKRVIEWGPGLSTRIIHEECPKAYILSIEHNERYFRKAVADHGTYADIRFVRATGPKSQYAVLPMMENMEPFDLAFIDGRRRLECALVAKLVVRSTGLIIIHDFHRPHYRLPIAGLNLIRLKSLDSMTGVFLA